MQREREMEGDEFEGKDIFVTQAYKDQMEEVRKAEEEEKRREGACSCIWVISLPTPNSELAKKNKGVTTGMSHMYRQLLDQSEQSHEATVAATKKPVVGPEPNLTITKPPDFTPKSDVQLAEEAKAQGKDIELNDDNQIVDKRELLAAGLNLSAPNTRNLGTLGKKSQAKDDQPIAHRAAGVAASRKEINERRAREMRQQMAEEQARVAEEKERQEAESIRRTVAKRNDASDVQSARERYLERKRQRLEAAETADKPSE